MGVVSEVALVRYAFPHLTNQPGKIWSLQFISIVENSVNREKVREKNDYY